MKSKRPLIILAAAAALLALPVYSVLGGDGEPAPPSEYRVREQAALGDSFTYQGRLTENNAPANGTYDLRFTIFGAASGSAQVCDDADDDIEVRDNVTVTAGLFTVQLEFCAEAFEGDARWLEIALRAGSSTGTYTILSPRQPISPTPYALYAKQAAAVDVPLVASGESTDPEPIVEIDQNETSNAGAAIDIDGAIRVSGNKAAFSVLVDVAENVCDSDGGGEDDAVIVPDTIADEATDLLFVTRNGLVGVGEFGVAFSPGDDCPADTWVIYVVGVDAVMADDVAFNVLVIKQEVIE